MMKKEKVIFCAVLVSAAIRLPAAAVQADPGDVAGSYYSTDIVTSVNGSEIDSINIGGNTLISAEDMIYYSFNVEWNADERTLRVDSVPQAVNGAPPAVTKTDVPAGSVLGSYYETDIVTYLDGEAIEAYNIGGRTYLHAEAMRELGYEVVWNDEARTLDVTSPDRAGKIYSSRIADQQDKEGYSYEGDGAMAFSYTPEGTVGRGDAERCNIIFGSDNGREMYIRIYNLTNTAVSSYPQALFQRMREIAYTGNIPVQYEPEERYEDVRALASISINGQSANEIAVMQTQGNGHVDYIFIIQDLPVYRVEDIESIEFVFGTPPDTVYELKTNQ